MATSKPHDPLGRVPKRHDGRKSDVRGYLVKAYQGYGDLVVVRGNVLGKRSKVFQLSDRSMVRDEIEMVCSSTLRAKVVFHSVNRQCLRNVKIQAKAWSSTC